MSDKILYRGIETIGFDIEKQHLVITESITYENDVNDPVYIDHRYDLSKLKVEE